MSRISEVFQTRFNSVSERLTHPTPETIAKTLATVFDLIPIRGKEHWKEIKELQESGSKLVILPPHWSVADIALFYVVAKELSTTIVGPISQKFFDGRMGQLGEVAPSLKKLNLDLYPVVQVQDETEPDRRQNTSAWLDIIRRFKRGAVLGIFPQGTRSPEIGARRAPESITEFIDEKIFKKNPDNLYLVQIYLKDAHEFWSTGKPKPNIFKFFQLAIHLGKPIPYARASEIAQQIPCPVSEVPMIVSLSELPPENWGDYTAKVSEYDRLFKSKK